MHNFPPQSKVWVYMANRFFTAEETQWLTEQLAVFTTQWTAHNMQLHAAGQVRHHRFIILSVDETQTGASGCSIDKSVHFIQQVQNQLGVELFNRQMIAYKHTDELKTVHLDDLAQLIETGEITPETIVYNNAVTTKQQLDNEWEKPISQSWMKRYLPTPILPH